MMNYSTVTSAECLICTDGWQMKGKHCQNSFRSLWLCYLCWRDKTPFFQNIFLIMVMERVVSPIGFHFGLALVLLMVTAYDSYHFHTHQTIQLPVVPEICILVFLYNIRLLHCWCDTLVQASERHWIWSYN